MWFRDKETKENTGELTAAHLKVCKAPETHCNYCGLKGHFEKCCTSKQKDKLKKIANPKNFDRKLQNADRVQRVDYYEDDQDSDSDEIKFIVESEGTQKPAPYYKEGWIKEFRLKTMIDTGSPVTIFEKDEIKTIMRRKDLQIRRMVEEEKYVDSNCKRLNFLGYVFCQLQVGEKFIKKAKILVATEWTKSIVGKEWLTTLKFVMVQNPRQEIIVIEKEVKQLSV